MQILKVFLLIKVADSPLQIYSISFIQNKLKATDLKAVKIINHVSLTVYALINTFICFSLISLRSCELVWRNQSTAVIRMSICSVLKLANHVINDEIIKKTLCIWYRTPPHGPLVLCQTLLYTCMAVGSNLPVIWSAISLSVVVRLSLSFYPNKQGLHQTLCWCPVYQTNYGHLCSFYGNLCRLMLWSFLRAVVLNMRHNGACVAMARCLCLHGV